LVSALVGNVMRYRLRTLLILLAVGPIVLAAGVTAGSRAIARYRERLRLHHSAEQEALFDPGGPPAPMDPDWRDTR
jgi:hypothetical protein